jgi:autotransporter-associated beta strand protein
MKTMQRRFSKAALTVAAVVACLSGTATAQSTLKIWDGQYGVNWSGNGLGGLNWQTNTTPKVPATPQNGDSLRWLSTSTLSKVSNNDLDGLSVAGISFQGAPSGVEIDGNKVTVTGTIGSSSGGGTGIINLPLELNNATVVIGGVNADTITINGTISELDGSRAVRVSGGNITLSGSNSFSGNVQLGYTASTGTATVNVNTLANTGVSQSLGTGSLVTFGFRTSTGTVVYTGGASSTNKGFAIGENGNTGSAAVSGAVGRFINNGSGAVVWSGAQTKLSQAAGTDRTFVLGGTNTDNNTWQSAIENNTAGTIGFTKIDVGKWILSGANTYTGATSVQQGVLLVDGSTAAGSAVSVSANAVFGGNGTVNGDLTLASGALFAFDPGDTLDLAGTLSIDSSFGVASLRNTSGGEIDWSTIAQGTYTLMNTTFAFNAGNIANFGPANAESVGSGKTAYFQNGSLQLVVVPEPAALSLAAVGVAFSGWAAWRRRRG